MVLRISSSLFFSSLLIGAIVVTESLAAEPAALPEFSAIYTLSKGNIKIGETTRTLTINNSGANIFESITRPAGLGRLFASGDVTERSEWIYYEGRPRPVTYTYLDSSRKQERNVQLKFDWNKNRVTNTINGDPWKMELFPGTHDKLIYQIRLMIDLPSASGHLDYSVADGGKLKEYRLDILGPETIKTKLGVFEAIRIQRISGERVTTFWCVKDLRYLPVRIEQRKGKKSPITAALTSVQGLP